MDGWMDQMAGWVDVQMDRQTDGWMVGQIRQIDGQMDGQMIDIELAAKFVQVFL